jgi:hypothetical protein
MSSGGRIRRIPAELVGPNNTSGVWNFNEISQLMNTNNWNLRFLSQISGSGGAALNGEASLITFWGNGSDANLTVTNNNTIINSYTHLTTTANSGSNQITVSDASNFNVGDEILLYQTQALTASQTGLYQFNLIESKNNNIINLKNNLLYSFLGATFNSISGITFQNLTAGGSFVLGGLHGVVNGGRPSDDQMTNGDIVPVAPLVGSSLYTSINYGDLGDNYGFIAIGYFRPPTTGTYTFVTSSDDGSAVWVGDIASATTGRTLSNVVVNNNATGYQGDTRRSGTISLNANEYYPIRIIHREGDGGSNLTFSWAGPGIAETTNLAQYFYYYQTASSVNSQIIKVPNYSDLTVASGSVVCKTWDGFSGGVVAFRCSGNLILNSGTKISTTGRGFRGGQQASSSGNYEYGYAGENYTRFNNSRERTSAAFLTAGGAGRGGDGSGGGGSHSSVGFDGSKQLSSSDFGRGATTLVGDTNLNNMHFGGGGGSVGSHSNGRIGVAGGGGGGTILILCKNSIIDGVIESNGGSGTTGVFNFDSNSASGGGGGAGGTVNFVTQSPFNISDEANWNNVSLSLNFDDGFNDLGPKKYRASVFGNPTISSVQSKFGGSSAFFNGSSYISFPASNDFNFGTGDFTIECWVYLLSQGTGGTGGYNHYFSVVNQNTFTFKSYEGYYYLYANDATQVQTAAAPVLNSWQHLALVRNGTSLRIYVNGTLAGSSTINANTSYGANGASFIGSPTNPNGEFLNGYLDEFRLTKGISRYNANFTPSTVAFQKEKLYAIGGRGGFSNGGNGKVGGSGGAGRVKTFVLPSNFKEPIQPLELAAVSENASVSLTWKTLTPPVDLINHLVEYTPTGGSAQTILTNSTNNTFNLTNLINGTNYNVRVASIDSRDNQSDWSNTVVAMPKLNPPLAVGVNPNIWCDTSTLTSANGTQLSTITNLGTSGSITCTGVVKTNGLNGLTTVTFNTAQIFSPTNQPNLAQHSLFAVTRQTGGSNGRVWNGISGSNQLYGYWNGQKRVIHISGNPQNLSSTGHQGSDTNWNILSFRRTAGGAYLFNWDGTTVISGGSSTSNGLIGLTINNGDYGEQSNCEFSEVILYPSVLSDANFQLIEGYLAWKFGLVANLPSNHPYKNTSP